MTFTDFTCCFEPCYRVIKPDNQPIHNTNDDDTVAVQKEIRCQNDEYYGIYDYVVKNVSKDDQIKILDFNGQMVPDTDDQVNYY